MSSPDIRFAGIARLYGAVGLAKFRASRVMVVGVGGVGSWVVEALARSGIGHLSLVDLDELCASNINRQLPALEDTVGRPKVDVLAERIAGINPGCIVERHLAFYTEASEGELLPAPNPASPTPEQSPGCVVDAIDSVANKCRLIVRCHAQRIPLICCGGAGGRRDPTRIRIEDLSRVTHDRLLAEVRKRLRRDHGFPRDGRKMGIPCVFSDEPPVFPQVDGTVCTARTAHPGQELRLNCEAGLGSATFVTGAFGFAAAAWVAGRLADG